MEEDKDGSSVIPLRPLHPPAQRSPAQRLCALLVLCLGLHTLEAAASDPRRHFQVEAGDAPTTLNEFSRQSDLQVLFDFNVIKGIKTRAVHGNLDASTALRSMLKGTNLTFDFVNSRTLTVTPKRGSPLGRLWHGVNNRPPRTVSAGDLEQVLISGAAANGTLPLLGAESITLDRRDIERSGLATAEDFLRTLPQVFGGGPNQDTVLGREAGTNSARGSGVNLRGLDAGATLVLIDGKRLAPSGTAGAFEDIANIPLSIIDHVDVLPDGASAKYGADAAGGVVNFVTRSNFSGIQTQARAGTVTRGSMGERQVSQLFGNARGSGSDTLSFEYFARDALQARDRWQYTSDLTRFGGSNFDSPYGNPGTITDGVHFWPLPKGQSGTSLTSGALAQGAPNSYDPYQGTYIAPKEQRWSVFGKESQKLTDDLTLSAEGLFTRRNVQNIPVASLPLVLSVPASNPFYVNPTGAPGPVTVLEGTAAFFGPPASADKIDTGNFALGLSGSPGGGWTASGYVGYAFEKQHLVQYGQFNRSALQAALADTSPATAFNPFGDGAGTNPATLAKIRGDFLFDSVSTLKTLSLIAVGPALALPGGDLEATVGAEYRVQNFESINALPGVTADDSGSLGRRITATFGELRIPIVGEDNPLGVARRLELSVGARHDHYSDIGGESVPKLGLVWSLSRDLNLRSTWTRSFRPPNLTDMETKNSQSTVETLLDPKSPTGSTTVLALFGSNPGLSPERARSWTLGADVLPHFLPGATFSLTYFDISYSGRIDRAQFGPDVLALPNFSWLVTRNATAAQLKDACAQTLYQGASGSCLTSSATAILDNRLRNIALLKTSGIDMLARYSVENRAGKFDFGLTGTYLFKYSQANTPGSALLDILSTQNNPIKLRTRGMSSWTLRGLGVTTFINFQNGYRDTLSIPNRGVSPWTTVDLQLSYETTGGAQDWLGHLQVALNAQNLFDVYPPFLNNPVGVGYDQENGDLRGRMLSVEVRKRW